MVEPMQLGHVNIRVKDPARSEEVYTEVLGLEVTHRRETILFLSSNDLSHELAISPLGADAPGPDNSRVGTNHNAWQMASFDDLRQIYRRLKEENVEVLRIRQNACSMGIYFADPDGNENEVYFETSDARYRDGGRQGEFPEKFEEVPA